MAKSSTRSHPTGNEASHLSASGSRPDPGRIRAKAYEVYVTRVNRGRPGDAVSDWLTAERELKAEGAEEAGEKRSHRST